MAPHKPASTAQTPATKPAQASEDCSDTCSSGLPIVDGDTSSHCSGQKEDDEYRGETLELQVARLVKEQGRAKQEAREQRRRADAAETKCEQLNSLVQRLKWELSESAAREKELQAQVAALGRDRKAMQRLKDELEEVKAASWRESDMAAAAEAASRHQIDTLCAQLKACGVEPKLTDVAMERFPDEMNDQFETPVDLASDETAQKTPSKKKKQGANARMAANAAAIEEQRRVDEQRRQEELEQQAEEQRQLEEEEREREQRRLEEEELELTRAERAAAAQKAKEEKKQKAAEKKRQKEEQKLRVIKERDSFPPEDFEALQALRDSVKPEADVSSQDGDEDDFLDRQIERAQREEAAQAERAIVPITVTQMFLGGVSDVTEIVHINESLRKLQQQRQRAALKEKMQMRRELASMMGTASGRSTRR